MRDTYLNAPAESWDEEYRSGRWAYLSSLEQVPRYALIAAWIECLKPEGSVLDIGCGEGILTEWLRSCGHYHGIDISQIALARARDRDQLNGRKAFDCASAETFYQTCSMRFDCIVFNEVLYCCSDPIRILARYERLLNPGGYIIVSVTGFEPGCWKDIQTMYGKRFALYLRIENRQVMKSWDLAAISASK